MILRIFAALFGFIFAGLIWACPLFHGLKGDALEWIIALGLCGIMATVAALLFYFAVTGEDPT